jgi:hypothetical protein
MKKIATTLLLMSAFVFVPEMPATPVEAAETGYGAEVDFDLVEEFTGSAMMEAAAACPRGTFRVRKRTRTKTKLVNAALATGVGAALGAGIGGKRGALIGAGTGAGGYLTYRWVRDRRGRCVRRYM